jgi:hypothetical protein
MRKRNIALARPLSSWTRRRDMKDGRRLLLSREGADARA